MTSWLGSSSTLNVKAYLQQSTIPTNVQVEMLVSTPMPLKSSNTDNLCSLDI